MGRPQKIKKILIVGGGSSGWITASILKKKLGKEVQISLIEASDIPTLGVGEATVPSLIKLLKDLEISERIFLNHVHGSFKLGIKFVNWRSGGPEGNHTYYHPFGHMPKVGTIDMSQYWLRRWHLGQKEPFAQACSIIPKLCEDNKAPKGMDSADFEGVVEYAYHLDAGLLGNFLRNYATGLGVQSLIGKVQFVELNPQGEIDHLKTDTLGPLKADLYIDCSGFRGILITKALKEPFISYQNSLPADRAIAISIPRKQEESFLPNFTTAQALSSGWAWNIPLQTRRGTGYVYSSAHSSPEHAEEEFRSFLGPASNGANSQHIQIRTGRHKRNWVKNCVAIGLAGGFVEPLESSGLALIYSTAQALTAAILELPSDPKVMDKLNQYIGALYDVIRDFIIIHYCTTNRTDTPFWQSCQNEIQIPEGLNKKLERWEEKLPVEENYGSLVSLNHFNVSCILTGMGFISKNCKAGIQKMSLKQVEPAFERLKRQGQSFSAHLPSHSPYLNSLKE